MRKLVLLVIFMYVFYLVTSCVATLYNFNKTVNEINKWNKTFEEGENK